MFLGSAPTTPVILPKDSVALQLLQRVRDEAHRFAITFHRNLRSKHLSESALKNIPGVGAKTAAKLIKAFGSAEQIKHKTADEIATVQGISKKKAEEILKGLNAGGESANDAIVDEFASANGSDAPLKPNTDAKNEE